MGKKEPKLMITFHTTAGVIAMETVRRKMEIPGRLIPVSRQISVGCGSPWNMPEGQRRRILEPTGVQELGYQTTGTYLT